MPTIVTAHSFCAFRDFPSGIRDARVNFNLFGNALSQHRLLRFLHTLEVMTPNAMDWNLNTVILSWYTEVRTFPLWRLIILRYQMENVTVVSVASRLPSFRYSIVLDYKLVKEKPRSEYTRWLSRMKSFKWGRRLHFQVLKWTQSEVIFSFAHHQFSGFLFCSCVVWKTND